MPKTKRLTGAALYNRVVTDLREELARDYGLPMGEYEHEIADVHSIGSDMQPILAVTFTREATGNTITVCNIHPADDGTVDQRSADIEMR